MRTVGLFFFPFLFSCSTVYRIEPPDAVHIPGTVNSYYQPFDAPVCPRHVAYTFAVFRQWWDFFYGSDEHTFDHLDHMKVRFMPAAIKLPESHPTADYAIGLTISTTEVWVSLNNGDTEVPVSNSSLVHELVHTTLQALGNEPDLDHATGEEYGDSWTVDHDRLISQAKLDLRSLFQEDRPIEERDERTKSICTF